MQDVPKLMADGKKSPEYTRLVLAFLAGVAVTVLIMSLTAGSLLQGALIPMRGTFSTTTTVTKTSTSAPTITTVDKPSTIDTYTTTADKTSTTDGASNDIPSTEQDDGIEDITSSTRP